MIKSTAESNKGTVVKRVRDVEELDEEEMLMRAIAMSLEGVEEEDREVAEEELFNAKGKLLKEATLHQNTNLTSLHLSTFQMIQKLRMRKNC